MKTLVTGGTGFIGSRLIERLRQQGDTVVCVAKEPLNIKALEAIGVETILGDLNQGIHWESVLPDVEIIFHIAGVTHARSTKEYFEGNTLATRHFVEAVKLHAHRLRRFLYVSSQTAAGPSPDGSPLDECAPCHPVSAYGRSKLLAEQAVLEAASSFPVTIVRPSAVYGPRERDMFDYMRTIGHGFHLLIGFRPKFVNLIHVDDLVDGIVRAACSPNAIGQIYFLGSEQTYNEEEVGNAIAEVLRCHPIRIHVPHIAAYALGAVGDILGLLLRRQVFLNVQKVREVVQSSWACSVEKARLQVGFKQRIPLTDGMRTTYLWYREHGWM